MFDQAARDFLQRPLIARLATHGHDGYPHVVPIWFLLEGDDIVFISDFSNRKTKNALASAKGAVVIGGDIADGAGYLIRGDFTIVPDTDQSMTHRMIDRYEPNPEGDRMKEAWREDEIAIIRLKPTSVVKVF